MGFGVVVDGERLRRLLSAPDGSCWRTAMPGLRRTARESLVEGRTTELCRAREGALLAAPRARARSC